MSDTLPTIEMLRAIVAPLKDTRAVLSVPYTYEMEGQVWTVACDGIGLLALRGDRGGAVWYAGSTPDFKTIILPHPVTGWCAVDAGKLVAFGAAAAPDPTTCKHCNGTGQRLVNDCEECEGTGVIYVECPTCGDEHEHDCEECEGKADKPSPCGRCNDPQRLSGLFGVAKVDRANFWRWLSWLAPDAEVEANVVGPERAIRFRGPDWFALIMPMRHGDNATESPEVFDGWLTTTVGARLRRGRNENHRRPCGRRVAREKREHRGACPHRMGTRLPTSG